ncbi:hypothetical protein DMUE_2924 [Dictyocoela muelleri]|nr:hypothetical protein DMUE_2924 [Dictyocoela muelleri]
MDVLEYIKCMEEIIIEVSKYIQKNKNLSDFQTKSNFKSRKYCSFHKYSTHNTEKCKGLNITERKESMLLEIICKKGNILSIKALINEKTITCLIDTGSNFSYQ